MEGEGLGDIINKIKEVASAKSFKTVANLVRKTIKGARPLKDGEYHFLGANFLGPGTRIDLAAVRNTKPLNAPDAVAKQHDLDYFEASKLEDEGERKDAIREADNKMIRALKEMGKLEGIDEVYRQAGLKGIQFKRKVENVSPSFAKQLLPADLLGQKKGGMDTDDYDFDNESIESRIARERERDELRELEIDELREKEKEKIPEKIKALTEAANEKFQQSFNQNTTEEEKKYKKLPEDISKKIIGYVDDLDEMAHQYNQQVNRYINYHRRSNLEKRLRQEEQRRRREEAKRQYERKMKGWKSSFGSGMMMGSGMKDKIISNSRRFNY